jgi:aldose 1-epimerase
MTPATGHIQLTRGRTSVEIDPSAGGRLVQVVANGEPLLVDAGPEPDPTSMSWGSFPMAPWAGRIRNGAFRFGGVDHRLATNHSDGDGPERSHAMHGTVFGRRWSIDDADASSISMSCQLGGALGWPFGGVARQRIGVQADGHVRLDLEVESDAPAAAGGEFPAEIGWHPWFRKPERLGFEPVAMYRRDHVGLPTGELIDPEPGPWDDCFVNTAPVVLHYARERASEIRVESDCDHWVVFDEPDHATCVEPQSGPPDAFNLPGVTAHLVVPGEPLRRWMTIRW